MDAFERAIDAGRTDALVRLRVLNSQGARIVVLRVK
jgi:hypothetical protein